MYFAQVLVDYARQSKQHFHDQSDEDWDLIYADSSKIQYSAMDGSSFEQIYVFNCKDLENTRTKGHILAIVLGSVGGVLLISAVVYYYFRKRNIQRRNSEYRGLTEKTQGQRHIQ